MKQYEQYEIDDFLVDDAFIDWVQARPGADNAFWKTFFATHPDKRPVADEAAGIIRSLAFAASGPDVAFYRRLKGRIDTTIAQEAVKKPNGRTMALFTPLRVAASLLLLVGCAALVWRVFRHAEMLTLTTGYAEMKSITLPDGTEVTLNASSSLRYPQHWNAMRREVRLEGEGFFKVTHLADAAGKASHFIVRADAASIEVLGTQFNVNSRDDGTTVALQQGSVHVYKEYANRITLKPGETARYDPQAGNIEKTAGNAGTANAWMAKQYVFEATPLREVCRSLQHYFGKRFIIEDPAMSVRRISGTLDVRTEGVTIQTLSALLSTRVAAQGDSIIIRKAK